MTLLEEAFVKGAILGVASVLLPVMGASLVAFWRFIVDKRRNRQLRRQWRASRVSWVNGLPTATIPIDVAIWVYPDIPGTSGGVTTAECGTTVAVVPYNWQQVRVSGCDAQPADNDDVGN